MLDHKVGLLIHEPMVKGLYIWTGILNTWQLCIVFSVIVDAGSNEISSLKNTSNGDYYS